ncbi:Bone morphogenetic protein receptor type-1A [Grifola frondosa]|uniref:mitogen-activated protein kinase kinase n=1 Tax=Grifola frondosa TaxID=5627 RepID=A0A1C7MEE7_GRIFR|nr:Bone morphogenetic protein receptor type-1A [Grifola frondosa]
MHNDIKPENILIDVYGRCVISDFGLALGPISETDDFSDFRMEQQVGTPGYMAPEVAAFSEDSVGFNYKADVYSLGLVLLEMALGLKDPYWDCTTAEEQIGLMSSKPLHWDDFRLSPVVEDFLGKVWGPYYFRLLMYKIEYVISTDARNGPDEKVAPTTVNTP